MQNKIDDLRNHLFATLEALADKDEPMALDRARVIADVAQTIINSAKVEVDAMQVTRRLTSSKFLQLPEQAEAKLAIAGPVRQ